MWIQKTIVMSNDVDIIEDVVIKISQCLEEFDGVNSLIVLQALFTTVAAVSFHSTDKREDIRRWLPNAILTTFDQVCKMEDKKRGPKSP